ncbi:MAG: ATP synthase F1 subunit delta [Phycisphaerales bacterium]
MSSGAAAHITDTYSQSLLDLAVQLEVLDAVETDLEVISTLLTEQPALGAFLASPYFAEQAKRDLIRKVFTDRLNRITFNFLSVVIDHGREALLSRIIDQFRQSCRALHGYKTVTATVARPLHKEQVARLTQDLALAMSAKVDLDVHVDPAILGGVILRYDDKMLDNSVRGRLVRTITQTASPQNRHERQLAKEDA